MLKEKSEYGYERAKYNTYCLLGDLLIIFLTENAYLTIKKKLFKPLNLFSL